ncbi:hypothetical protein BSKO_04584 [Bryopsis sp. KO-2023]|nr:hypothetical protein BSKO_04584 [Bryopsis sp. KO-2023]
MAACFVGYGAGGYTFLPSSRLSSSRRSFARKRAIEDGANLSTDTDRNAKGAVRGTYYWKQEDSAQPVTVTFDTASGEVVAEAREGENVLRVAQKCKAVKDDPDFCYEGTCELCVMEIKGVAEVGQRRDPKAGEFVRTCITPVPPRDIVKVKVPSDEDLWSNSFV